MLQSCLPNHEVVQEVKVMKARRAQDRKAIVFASCFSEAATILLCEAPAGVRNVWDSEPGKFSGTHSRLNASHTSRGVSITNNNNRHGEQNSFASLSNNLQ